MAQTRDIIVIGASLGGIEALQVLAADLPADLPAAIFLVQHVAPESPGALAEILARAGPLPAVTATDGMAIERGRIVVAPPDRHLLLSETNARVLFGPRENRARPAIDPLFRTAAVNHRSRVVGVVLTGLLDDGAAGLHAVHRCGGVALVQNPEDAAHPEMPSRARAAVPDARVCALRDLGAELTRLTRAAAPRPPPVPEMLRVEATLTERAMRNVDWNGLPGRAVDFTCPECRGALREVDDEVLRYRCRVGHAYTADSLIAAKNGSAEESLWVALQTLEERAQMLETMARDDARRGWHRSAKAISERAREAREHAASLRAFIHELVAAPGALS